MNFKKLLLIFLILFVSACNQYDKKEKTLVHKSYQKYSNTGFALIYDDELKKNKKSIEIINTSFLKFIFKFIF